MKKKQLIALGALLLILIPIAYATYSYFFNTSVVLRQYVSPAIYTHDMGILYTSITHQDSYDSGWFTPQSWKTWGKAEFDVYFLNKETLDDYFKRFIVEIQFNSERYGTLEEFTLGFDETNEELKYSFVVSEADCGNITLRIIAEPLDDLGFSFGEHEVTLEALPLIEWCP